MYYFHHHCNYISILKKNFEEEYSRLIDKYGKENIELEKNLLFAYRYKCWINETNGEWIYDPLISEYVYISDNEDNE